MEKIILYIFSYIYGSIPFGLILVRVIKGVDIRKIGSGNIGATNVSRVLGLKLGLVSGILDVSKGLIPVIIGKYLGLSTTELFFAGFLGVVGHDFSIFLSFKGGKGVASTLGFILALNPLVILIEIVPFFVTFFITRIVSLSSILALIFLPISFLIVGDRTLALLSLIPAALGILRHRENIERLIYGIEKKFGEKELVETEILKEDSFGLNRTKEVLMKGGVGIIPTDTVYGLCTNALNREGIKRIYRIKRRDIKKPLVLFVKDKGEIEKYGVVNDTARKIIDSFIPGPITIVLKRREGAPKISLRDIDTIGIRIPDEEFVINLLKNLDFPLATTSANLSGEETPKDISSLKKTFSGIVDFIVDGGEKSGTPSTVVSIIGEDVKILREGRIKKEEILKIINE